MKLIVYAKTNKVGSKVEREIEIDGDEDEDTIEEIARDTMFEMIDWGWEKKE